jgi:signal transduction histidine kinase
MAAGIAAAIAASLLGVGISLWVSLMDDQPAPTPAFNAAVVVAFTAVGAVVAAARPTNGVGWAMLMGGVLWSVGGAGADLAHHGIVAEPGSVPGVAVWAIGGQSFRGLGWIAVTLVVPALFPDGQRIEKRWLARVLVIIVVASVIDTLTDKQAGLTTLGVWRNPIAPARPWDLISMLAFLAHVPLSLVATIGVVALLIGRWRHGDVLRRQQLTLLAVAAALPFVAAPVAFATGSGGWIFGAAAVPLPFAIGFAVLARGLYDLRTAANRTLVWLTLSAVVAAVYALFMAGASSLLHVGRDVAWLPWVAAAIVAVSFAPFRDGLQRAVNRVTFGHWDEPYEVLAALGQRLEASGDADRLLADVIAELHGLGLHDVSVVDQLGEPVAGEPVEAADVVSIPLAAYGQPVGTLRYRNPTTPMRARDRRLLDDLAGHLGAVLHARHLTRDLQTALERLVVAREEERRRLRRDLHDGLGPALAGHLLRLDVIAGKVSPGSPAATDIDTLRDELRATVFEVRRVVEGLRPPALDELGLAGALEQVTLRLTAGTSIDVDIHVDDLPPLPAATEVAAFRIVTEAVTNTVRHAHATTCHAAIHAVNGQLRIEVTDDGQGLPNEPSAPTGHGLQTMRERAAELGGDLQVATRDGVTITAVLPLSPLTSSARAAIGRRS